MTEPEHEAVRQTRRDLDQFVTAIEKTVQDLVAEIRLLKDSNADRDK